MNSLQILLYYAFNILSYKRSKQLVRHPPFMRIGCCHGNKLGISLSYKVFNYAIVGVESSNINKKMFTQRRLTTHMHLFNKPYNRIVLYTCMSQHCKIMQS